MQTFDIVSSKTLDGIMHQYRLLGDRIEIVATQLISHKIEYDASLTPQLKTIQTSLLVVKEVAGYQTIVGI